MARYDDVVQPHLTTIEVDGRRFNVSCRVVFDGIEYVGRLWFADEATNEVGLPDRGAIPGLSKEEVIARAKRLQVEDLQRRYRRGLAEKRRYGALRRATEEILTKIRYLNQLSISMRGGLLDVEGAAQEIDLTEGQLHELIDRLRTLAGVEDL
jgi:hypothetical protein